MRPAEEKKKKENKRKGKRAWTKVRKISRLLIFRTASARRFHKMSPGRSMLRERGAHAPGSVSLSVIKRVRTGRNGKYDAGKRCEPGGEIWKLLEPRLFPAAYLQLYARYSIFTCVHCSRRGNGGNKALSLSRNNVPLSIRAWNNWLQPSARIAIIDHVCDVCPDIDIESLFNTDEWLPLDGTVEFFFPFFVFFPFFLSFFDQRERERERASEISPPATVAFARSANTESSVRFTSALLLIRRQHPWLLPRFDPRFSLSLSLSLSFSFSLSDKTHQPRKVIEPGYRVFSKSFARPGFHGSNGSVRVNFPLKSAEVSEIPR